MIEIKGIRKLEQLKDYISTLPRNVRGKATRDAAIYLVGNNSRGLQHYPRQAAHVKYKRTYNYRMGWRVTDEGVKSKIVNNVDYALYPRTRWAGSPWNWRTIADLIKSNMKGMIQEVNRAVQRYIDSTLPK
jgi:hypothetical protein